MDSVLGFMETRSDIVVDDQSCGYKLVPWISWDDWRFVRDSLLSSSPDSIASALRRISAWRSRGCVPVAIEITASIIEVQQKDPFFRDDVTDNALHSEEMLAMLYCMAIMRLVNGIVEKTRNKTEISIGEAADAIGIPRMLIDIRHEGSHRDLPSLRLVRLASVKALDWLKSYYWETQKMAIPSDRTANLRKEIKSALHELAFCLKIKQTRVSSSSASKGKRVRHCEHLCGRNKFLSLMAGKLQSSKPAGSKKQITKILKKFVRLYSSFSSEVVSVLLEFLLKALDSATLEDLPKVGDNTSRLQTVFDDWKPVIMKLSNKEPEFIMSLLKAVLEMIETREAVKFEFRGDLLTSEYRAEFLNIEQLSYLFEWLVGNLKGLKIVSHRGSAAETEGSSTEPNLPKATLVEFLRKCLVVSSPESNRLTTSALVLARMIGNNSLIEKINKLALLHSSNLDFNEENTSEEILSQQEDSIRQAAEKLEFFKHHWVKSNNVNTSDGDTENKNRWVVVKSWNPCPIGMLPCAVGSSGLLPVLDCDDDPKEGKVLSETKEEWGLKQYSGKREAECAAEFLDGSSAKKMKESGEDLESNDEEDACLEGVKGQLMIGGVWKKAREEDVLAIASAVRILV